MKKILIFCLLFFLVSYTHVFADSNNKGVLLYPIEKEGKILIEPGCMINYMQTISNSKQIDIAIDGKIFQNISSWYIIPYDLEFSISRVYLYLIKNQNDDPEEIRNKYLLAKNILKYFPSHYLLEEIHALLCKYSNKYERITTDGKTNYQDTIKLYKNYIEKYPKGIYKDQFEWEIIEMQHHIYEFEGFAGGPLSQVKAFEKYLLNNHNSKMKDEIKSTIAKLYRIAYECIEYNEAENIKDGFTKQDGQKYLEKSLNMYTDLLASQNMKIKETARVALYNIKHQRRVYFNSNDW